MGKKASQRHSAYTVMQGVLPDHTEKQFKYSTREIDGLQFISKFEPLPAGSSGYETGDAMGLINVLGPTKKQLLFGVGIVRKGTDGQPYLAETSVEHKVEEAKRFVRDYKDYIGQSTQPQIPNNGNEIAVILRKVQSAIHEFDAQQAAAEAQKAVDAQKAAEAQAGVEGASESHEAETK